MEELNNELEQPTKSKRTHWVVLAIIVASFVVGCPLFYMSGSVDGRIVDAESGKPIPDAHIVGIWQLEGGLIEHRYLWPIHFEETVTDTDGRYHLEGFFIRLVTPNLSLAQLKDHDPIIYIFAEGYQPKGTSKGSKNKGIYRKSSLNGIDITLQRMPGLGKGEVLSWYSSVSSMKDSIQRCDLTKIPKTSDFILRMYRKFGESASDYRFIYDDEYSACK